MQWLNHVTEKMHRSQKLNADEMQIALAYNGSRSGVAVNMTVREFESSSLENGLHIISVSFSGV